MSAHTPGVFEDFAAAVGENPELCFNAGIIVLLRRNPALLATFLAWLSESSGLVLDPALAWSVHGERPVSAARRIFPDMVISAPGLELWFEHKFASRLKSNELVRYVEECHLRMHGNEAITAIDPAAFSPPAGAARVVVFVISGVTQRFPLPLHAWRNQFEELGCGLAWSGPDGYLRWRDFYPRAAAVVSGLEGFDATLAQQFLDWWQSSPIGGLG